MSWGQFGGFWWKKKFPVGICRRCLLSGDFGFFHIYRFDESFESVDKCMHTS